MDIFNLLNESTVQCIANEAYYGSNGKPIQKTREAFQEFYDLVKSDFHKFPLGTPQIKKLQNAICDQFGFKHVTIIPAPLGDPMIFTLPAYVCNKDKGKIIEETKDGLRFSDNSKYGITIFLPNGSFKDADSDELFAVLLHEIGHSFTSIMKMDYGFAFIESCYDIINEIRYHVATRLNDVVASVNEILDDSEFINNVLGIVYRISSYILNNRLFKFIAAMNYAKSILSIPNYIMSTPTAVKKILSNKKLKYIDRHIKAFNRIKPIFGFAKNTINNTVVRGTNPIDDGLFSRTGNEYFSDSFAVMYGYGPQLSSAFGKLMKYRRGNSMTGILNSIGDLQLIICKMDHPDDYQRIMSMIAHLKQELDLNKLLDSKSREEIQSQINKMESELNAVLKNKNMNIICTAYSTIMKTKKSSTEKAINNTDYSFGLRRE